MGWREERIIHPAEQGLGGIRYSYAPIFWEQLAREDTFISRPSCPSQPHKTNYYNTRQQLPLRVPMDEKSLLESLRALAEKIDARVIAEGVERDEERCTLLSLGIELGQGFFFHREE